jgi:hypothetical protein
MCCCTAQRQLPEQLQSRLMVAALLLLLPGKACALPAVWILCLLAVLFVQPLALPCCRVLLACLILLLLRLVLLLCQGLLLLL